MLNTTQTPVDEAIGEIRELTIAETQLVSGALGLGFFPHATGPLEPLVPSMPPFSDIPPLIDPLIDLPSPPPAGTLAA
jgi:hypothetical protein